MAFGFEEDQDWGETWRPPKAQLVGIFAYVEDNSRNIRNTAER
jgi:hypothetical protein